VGGNDHRRSLGLLVMARAVLSQLLMRDESALVAVALAATFCSSAALSQAEAETEVAPSQPVETVPTAPPAPSRAVPDEPAASTPPVVAPNTSAPSSSEPAAPSPETAPAPLPTGAPTSGPIESPAQASQGSSAARPTRYSATTLIVVNGRAVSATAVAVLVGTKAVARSGSLASNTRVTLKLPRIKGCRISVVASFPGWYSAITREKIDVCKTGRVLVRL
jgi:outer membrane biosynthesis protein TonB